MRHQLSNEEISELIKQERKRFKDLDAQKQSAWLANDLQAHEQVKVAWQDSIDEFNHLYEQRYTHFPILNRCDYCGSPMHPNGIVIVCALCGSVKDRPYR